MSGANLPVGCYIRIDKSELGAIIARLKELEYRVVGPTVSESAVVLGDIDTVDDLPIGYVDDQEAGRYALRFSQSGSYFDYVVGPHSLKGFLFPARTTVLECHRNGQGWEMQLPALHGEPLAVIGVRSCDLHALKMQDRIFLSDRFLNRDYEIRRHDLFVIAVNCGRAAATCFCTSMDTGPSATFGFDLALTELETHFVVEVGSEQGGKVAAATSWSPCSTREVSEAHQIPRRAEREMEQRRRAAADGSSNGRYLDTSGLRELLLNNLEHDRWEQVAERCLACGNCTMVCPTCFCSTVEELTDLSGSNVKRDRFWESCFTTEHSYMNSGTVRRAVAARYRQWLTHKLASWIDQFGKSGCVGCGRCITWCPVGIDLTEEVAAIRGEST